jgi:predicted RNase H-like HicB family nuclease
LKRTFTATVTQEDEWFVAQCLDIDVASQGETEKDALDSLREAIALHFTPPNATTLPVLRAIEIEIDPQ